MSRRFSVIIAVYNRENYICQAIDSVLSQTFRDYELIVVDDGSTDRTPEMLQSYGTRIKIIRQENQGSEMAYKAGVAHANGEYLAFLDSDDFFFPNALATYDKVIRALESPPLIIGAITRFELNRNVQANEPHGNHIEVLKYRDYLSKDVRIGLAQSRIVMRKSLFEEVQAGTGRPLARNMNDYRLILRTGASGPCIIVTRPVTLAYRKHKSQSSKNVAKMCQGVLYLIQLVRSGQCRRMYSARGPFKEYAYLGGIVLEWSGKALLSRLPRPAFKILVTGFPMLAAALTKKIFLAFSSSTTRFIIKNDSTADFREPASAWNKKIS